MISDSAEEASISFDVWLAWRAEAPPQPFLLQYLLLTEEEEFVNTVNR